MASTIAAITTGTGGVVTTADSSGNLSLLSGATTVVAVTSTGVAVTGTLSSSGATTLANGAVLGTPASGNLSNCTALNATQLTTGTMPSARLASGTVLQVVSATKTDTSSFTSSTFADIGTLTVTITPRNTSSTILVMASVGQSWVNAVTKSAWRLMRDATPIAIAAAAGSRIRATGAAYVQVENYTSSYSTVSYLDSPATASAVTYKCQASNMDGAGTVYVNRGNSDGDSVITPRTTSSITVFEIAG